MGRLRVNSTNMRGLRRGFPSGVSESFIVGVTCGVRRTGPSVFYACVIRCIMHLDMFGCVHAGGVYIEVCTCSKIGWLSFEKWLHGNTHRDMVIVKVS